MKENKTNHEMDRMYSIQSNLLRDSSDGILIINQDGAIMNINPKAKEIFGISDDYESKTYVELFMLNDRPENDAFHQFILDAIMDAESVRHGIANYTFDNGRSMIFNISSTFSRLKDGTSYLMIHLCDITKIEEARQAAENALYVKTNFLQNMTHEIRTPLNIINGMAQILTCEGMITSQTEYAEYSSIIRQHTDSLTMLVDDILVLCDIDSGTHNVNLQPCDANAIARSVADKYANQKSSIELSVTPLDGDSTFVCDDALISTALDKLVHNAVKFTDAGKVSIICSRDTDGSVVFTIEDTGKGIPAEERHNVFERFHKVDSFILGAGLGLSVCRDIMNILHGSVDIDDTYTNGCRFFLRLPQ